MANPGLNATLSDGYGREVKNKYVLIKDKPKCNKKAELAAKKRVLKKRLMLGLVYVAIFCVFLTAIMAYKNSVASEQRNYQVLRNLTDVIDSDELTLVEQLFHDKNLRGSWAYEGSQLHDDSIHVFIKIPEQLGYETNLQVQYIKNSLCPKSQNALWQHMRPEQLVLHLYVDNKAQNTGADCA